MTTETVEISDAYAFVPNSPKVAVPKEQIAKEIEVTKGHRVLVLKPVIDKIAITVTGKGVISKTKGLTAAEYWPGVMSMASDLAKDDAATKVSFVHYPRYRLAVRVELDDQSVFFLAFSDPKKAMAPLRIEFSPTKMKPTSLNLFAAFWSEQLEGGNLPIEALVSSARVGRLDVAVDVLNLSVADTFVFNKKLRKIWVGGTPESGVQTAYYYLGGTGADPVAFSPKRRAELTLYDKRVEQLAKGQKPIFGDLQHIRVERSLRKQALLKNLDKTSWPFDGWEARRAINCTAPLSPDRWRQFLDSVRFRGIEAGRRLLPHEERAELTTEKIKTLFPNDLLQAGLWKDQLPEVIKRGHLTEFLHWAKMKPDYYIPVGHLGVSN